VRSTDGTLVVRRIVTIGLVALDATLLNMRYRETAMVGVPPLAIDDD